MSPLKYHLAGRSTFNFNILYIVADIDFSFGYLNIALYTQLDILIDVI